MKGISDGNEGETLSGSVWVRGKNPVLRWFFLSDSFKVVAIFLTTPSCTFILNRNKASFYHYESGQEGRQLNEDQGIINFGNICYVAFNSC